MIYIQGDIQLVPCQKQDGKVIKHNGEFTLALGETTGHSHRVKVKEPEQMLIVKDTNGNLFINFLGEGVLTHEEHGTHTIKKGWYKLGNEREYDYWSLETRRVQD